jgi:hypothetical protein
MRADFPLQLESDRSAHPFASHVTVMRGVCLVANGHRRPEKNCLFLAAKLLACCLYLLVPKARRYEQNVSRWSADYLEFRALIWSANGDQIKLSVLKSFCVTLFV